MHLRSSEWEMGNIFSCTLEIPVSAMPLHGNKWGFLQSPAKWLHPIGLVNDLASVIRLSYQCNTSGMKAFVLKKIQLVQNASVHPFNNAHYRHLTITSSTLYTGKPVNPEALQWTTFLLQQNGSLEITAGLKHCHEGWPKPVERTALDKRDHLRSSPPPAAISSHALGSCLYLTLKRNLHPRDVSKPYQNKCPAEQITALVVLKARPTLHPCPNATEEMLKHGHKIKSYQPFLLALIWMPLKK